MLYFIVVFLWNYIYDKVMKSDMGIDFDLKVKCVEILLGKIVIGEIVF